MYAFITLHLVTKTKSDLLYVDGVQPTGSPAIADPSLPDAPTLLLLSATPASNAHHKAPTTIATPLQIQHARLLRHKLQAS